MGIAVYFKGVYKFRFKNVAVEESRHDLRGNIKLRISGLMFPLFNKVVLPAYLISNRIINYYIIVNDDLGGS
jgi:hypothetical protein